MACALKHKHTRSQEGAALCLEIECVTLVKTVHNFMYSSP